MMAVKAPRTSKKRKVAAKITDLDSEVHRFVGAGIVSVKENAARSVIRSCRKSWMESSGRKKPVQKKSSHCKSEEEEQDGERPKTADANENPEEGSAQDP